MVKACLTVAVTLGLLASILMAKDGPPSVPGGEKPSVRVNSQKTLIKVVETGFEDEAWTDPARMLPTEFPGLKLVEQPGSGKTGWRKPVVLKQDSTRTEVFINCYRWREKSVAALVPGTSSTPFQTITEPDYQYQRVDFHQLRAASATEKGRDVFVFRDRNLLFKVEATGGSEKSRRELVRSTAEAIWKSWQ